jgi:uncharacterized protein YqjF (DUF2071 family)
MTFGDFDRSIVEKADHRPWAMPKQLWVMTQTWSDLLFAHWPIDPAELRPAVPREFELDLFAHTGWLGIVPFSMTNVSPRGVPALRWFSAFPEINVRTYVRVRDRPGVYFFSLDASNAMAVKAARAILNLPYYLARMTVSRTGSEITYGSARRSGGPAEFNATYEPLGMPFAPVEGTLEYFLTERYCLYHRDRGGVPYRLDIHHPPWSLQLAKAVIRRNTMATAAGLSVTGQPPLLHFAQRQDVVAWWPSPL